MTNRYLFDHYRKRLAIVSLEFISFLKCAAFHLGALVVFPVEDQAERDLIFSEQAVDGGLALALENRPLVLFADEHVLEVGHDQHLSLFHVHRDYTVSLLEARNLLPSSLPSQPAFPPSWFPEAISEGLVMLGLCRRDWIGFSPSFSGTSQQNFHLPWWLNYFAPPRTSICSRNVFAQRDFTTPGKLSKKCLSQ